MRAGFVLVHSPLVGPCTWSWVADALRHEGVPVALPDLTAAAVTGRWEACVDAVVQSVVQVREPEVVLVGHSGAGPLLPTIAERLDGRANRTVFVDAGVPPDGSDAELVPADFRVFLAGIARDGVLPRWSEWFGTGAMEGLVTDPVRRRAVVADMVELPLAYFDGRVPRPGRPIERGAYVLLSEVYRADADEARRRGWPVVELLGAHLDIVNEPERVATALLNLGRARP